MAAPSDELACSLRALEVLLVGVGALNWFLQANYTGPETGECPPLPVFQDPGEALQSLAVDGELPHAGSTDVGLLAVARAVLATVADPTFPAWSSPIADQPIGEVEREEGQDARATGGGPVQSGGATKTSEYASRGVLDTRPERPRLKAPLKAIRASILVRGLGAAWSARAVVTHQRLLIAGDESSPTLWAEAEANFGAATAALAAQAAGVETGDRASRLASAAWLEFGLAKFHFTKGDLGKANFNTAKHLAGLVVEMTGALGKRTKFQQTSHAQMVLKASTGKAADQPAAEAPEAAPAPSLPHVEKQAEDSILLERMALDGEKGGSAKVDEVLGPLELGVLLALCLDVKNSNPVHGLTTEEMRPYVERVLMHHNNWTIYSTGLLQRAWLDFESYYSKDRATLQLQALVDQHASTLTLTQMSFDAVKNSAPARERLKFVHAVVYPPRWELKKDLASRYMELGVLVSASQLYEELELWDDALDCYARMGKKTEALSLVTAKLGGDYLDKPGAASPRMLCALGNLHAPPESTTHYEAAWTSSGRRFAKAARCLGREAVDLADACAAQAAKERSKLSEETNRPAEERTRDAAAEAAHLANSRRELERAEDLLGKALQLQPGHTSDWFVLGTVRMRLEKWQPALTAFSSVVAHMPDSGDAWGNVGAIHLRLKRPDLALAALAEGTKCSRESWRMWENRLLAALQVRPKPSAGDAILSASTLIDLHARGVGRGVDTPLLAAVTSAALAQEGLSTADTADAVAPPLKDESLEGDELRLSRPVGRRAGLLLDKVTATTKRATEPKTWEIFAIFNLALGRRRAAREARMKHVRLLQSQTGWEKRAESIQALADAAADLVAVHALPLHTDPKAPEPATPQPPPPPPAGSSSAEGSVSKENQQQLSVVAMLLRGCVKKSEAYGGAGSSGDGARLKLKGALTDAEALLAKASPP